MDFLERKRTFTSLSVEMGSIPDNIVSKILHISVSNFF